MMDTLCSSSVKKDPFFAINLRRWEILWFFCFILLLDFLFLSLGDLDSLVKHMGTCSCSQLSIPAWLGKNK
jgi:hypothetical protein